MYLIPRMKVAATKPARSPITPPPTAMMAASRPNPASSMSSVRRAQVSRVLDASPAGTVNVRVPTEPSACTTRSPCVRATLLSVITA
jgi:hypothetical protein